MTSRLSVIRQLALSLAGLACLAAADHSTLTNQVICGYQGWFRTPSDGMSSHWEHYGQPHGSTIEFWPDMSELTPAERFATAQRLADGRPAELFSAVIPATVDRHFAWMRTYGIDGALVQRFVGSVITRRGEINSRLASVDQVLRNARAGAQHHERSWGVMYDLSGLRAGEMELVMADWRHLVDDLGVRKKDPSYQGHRGKPLVAVWGLGFNDGRKYTIAEVERLVRFLKDDPVYGGNAVLLGVPTFWRTGQRDAVADPALQRVIAQADVVQPWLVDRFATPEDVTGWVEQHLKDDLAWCAQHGVDYMPVLFPGFRWTNNDVGKPKQAPQPTSGFVWETKEIPRLGGRFLWAQYAAAQRAGATLFYQAMFDEMDEGTAIFKCTNDVPVPNGGLTWQTYEGLPSDHYLKLLGLVGRYLREGKTLPTTLPDLRALPPAPELKTLP